MQINLISGFILFSGVMAMLWALSQVIMLRRNINNIILSGFYFCIGIMQVYHSFMITGFLQGHSFLAMVHLPFLYLIGPLFYIFFMFLSLSDYRFKSRDILHLLPAVGIAALLSPIYIQDQETKRVLLHNPPNLVDSAGISIVYPIAVLIVQVSVLLYMLFFIKNSMYIWKKKYLEQKKGVVFIHVLLVLGCIIFLSFIVNFILLNLRYIEFNYHRYISFIEFFSFCVALVMMCYFLLLVRYPNYFRQLQFDYQRGQYLQSKIEGIDADRILEKIDLLLGTEKLYCDDDLNLGRLAKILSIAPYQLSQLINEKKDKNFKTFINEYRINESMKQIVECPEKSVISIAYEVGFNSKSAFYKWFLKFTGQSPTEYRKNRPE